MRPLADVQGAGGGGVVSIGIALVMMLFVFTIFFAVPIWGIVDAIRRPPEAWEAAGQSKSLWIAIQFFAWIFGSLIYALAVRPRLKQVSAVGAHERT